MLSGPGLPQRAVAGHGALPQPESVLISVGPDTTDTMLMPGSGLLPETMLVSEGHALLVAV